MEARDTVIEQLAELEHKQWIIWAKNIIPELNDALHKLPEGFKEAEAINRRLIKWSKLLIPYSQLTEEQKEQDRIWARLVYEVAFKAGVESEVEHSTELYKKYWDAVREEGCKAGRQKVVEWIENHSGSLDGQREQWQGQKKEWGIG